MALAATDLAAEAAAVQIASGKDRFSISVWRLRSGTHEAHSSYRVMPVAMATGHAAGVCAALAAKQGKFPRDVHVHEVQEELLAHGANLGEQCSLRKHR
jgi:hypothetical protein